MLLRHISGVEKVVNKADGLRTDCQLNLLCATCFLVNCIHSILLTCHKLILITCVFPLYFCTIYSSNLQHKFFLLCPNNKQE